MAGVMVDFWIVPGSTCKETFYQNKNKALQENGRILIDFSDLLLEVYRYKYEGILYMGLSRKNNPT